MKRSATLFTFILIFTLTGCKENFFKVASSSFVKEYCSCRFVVGQSSSYCYRYASQIIPVSSYQEIKKEHKVLAYALGFSSEAIFLDQKKGCVLTK